MRAWWREEALGGGAVGLQWQAAGVALPSECGAGGGGAGLHGRHARRPSRLDRRPLDRRRRRILLFPTGNNVTQLSVYLDVADSATLPQGWSRQAHFTLTVHNQKDPSRLLNRCNSIGSCRY